MNELLQRYLEVVSYKVESSFEHLYKCCDGEITVINSDDCDTNDFRNSSTWSSSIYINTRTHKTMCVTIWDYSNKVMYRYFTDNEFKDAYLEEEDCHNPANVHPDDIVIVIQLTDENDFFDKFYCIVHRLSYSPDKPDAMPSESDTTYATIPLDISDADFLILAKDAHEKDMKFNDYIVDILMQVIKERENNDSRI